MGYLWDILGAAFGLTLLFKGDDMPMGMSCEGGSRDEKQTPQWQEVNREMTYLTAGLFLEWSLFQQCGFLMGLRDRMGCRGEGDGVLMNQ